jgi:hypothetical protein
MSRLHFLHVLLVSLALSCAVDSTSSPDNAGPGLDFPSAVDDDRETSVIPSGGAEPLTLLSRPANPVDVILPGNDRFVVHEWGTFTSMQSSEGASMEGLHHEDEPLPAFVYGRAPAVADSEDPAGQKSMEFLPEGVTQKMETPVIYFYAPEAMAVSVEVGFPDGVISQWYPNAAWFGPEIGALTRTVMA